MAAVVFDSKGQRWNTNIGDVTVICHYICTHFLIKAISQHFQEEKKNKKTVKRRVKVRVHVDSSLNYYVLQSLRLVVVLLHLLFLAHHLKKPI